MKDDRKFPLQQGDLDWLCSSYAAVNLLALRDRIKTPRQADKVFAKLIEALPAYEWNLARYLVEGVDPNLDVHDLVKAAGFSNAVSIEPDELASSVRKPGPQGFLIYLKERAAQHPFSHYTLIKRVTRDGGFELFDSCGFERIEQSKDTYTLNGYPIMIKAAWQIED